MSSNCRYPPPPPTQDIQITLGLIADTIGISRAITREIEQLKTLLLCASHEHLLLVESLERAYAHTRAPGAVPTVNSEELCYYLIERGQGLADTTAELATAMAALQVRLRVNLVRLAALTEAAAEVQVAL